MIVIGLLQHLNQVAMGRFYRRDYVLPVGPEKQLPHVDFSKCFTALQLEALGLVNLVDDV